MTTLSILALLVASGPAQDQTKDPAKDIPRYEVVSLGMLPECDTIVVSDVNDHGEVVGYCYEYFPPGHSGALGHAYLWRDGKMVPLKSLGGEYSYAKKINEGGMIVGEAETASRECPAVLWTLSGEKSLEQWATVTPFALTKKGSDATALDDASNIAIVQDDLSSILGPAGKRDLRALGRMKITALGPEGSFAGFTFWATRAGFGAGLWDTVQGQNAFSGQGQKITKFPRADFEVAEVNGGNRNGLWVGYYRLDGEERRACTWKDGKRTDLSSKDWKESVAFGANDQGDVVGYYRPKGEGTMAACLWRNGKVIDLNTLVPKDRKAKLYEATDINNKGWILCDGVLLRPKG